MSWKSLSVEDEHINDIEFYEMNENALTDLDKYALTAHGFEKVYHYIYFEYPTELLLV